MSYLQRYIRPGEMFLENASRESGSLIRLATYLVPRNDLFSEARQPAFLPEHAGSHTFLGGPWSFCSSLISLVTHSPNSEEANTLPFRFQNCCLSLRLLHLLDPRSHITHCL
jgi:hypothetical protein